MISKASTPSYVETYVKGFINDTFAMADLYLQNINEYLELLAESLKVTKYEMEGLKTKLMLLLSKYGSKDNLEHKRAQAKEKVKSTEEKMNQIIRLTRNMLETNSFQCTNCNGTGSVTKAKYVREGGIVTPYFSSSECLTCKGRGTINLPHWLQECLAMATRAANTIVQLGVRFLQTSENIATLFQEAEV